jgi:hypothetical protein
MYSVKCNNRCSKESEIIGKSKCGYVSDKSSGDTYSTETEENPKL